jgi:hypothetical protein
MISSNCEKMAPCDTYTKVQVNNRLDTEEIYKPEKSYAQLKIFCILNY